MAIMFETAMNYKGYIIKWTKIILYNAGAKRSVAVYNARVIQSLAALVPINTEYLSGLAQCHFNYH